MVAWCHISIYKDVDNNDVNNNDNDDDVQPVGWSVSLRRWGRCRPPGAGVARPRLSKYFLLGNAR